MQQAKRPSHSKVRYAVVGAGWISQAAFLPAVEQTRNSIVTALVTGDARKAELLRRKYRLEHTVGYDALETLFTRDAVDAVYLATPNQEHVELAVRTLSAGIHLLLEKPMAIGRAECERILAAAEQSGAKLMIAYRLHFEPATLSALEVVRGGALGDVKFFASSFGQYVAPQNHRAHQGYWAGPVPDMGTYPINAARQLFQAEPTEVYAIGTRDPALKMDCDDTVQVTMRFPGERLAQFTVSYATTSIGTYSVVGTKGSLEMRHGFSFEEPIEQVVKVGEHVDARTFARTDQFSGEIHAFSQHVLEDSPVHPDGVEGLADVRVLEGIERSLREGMPITLEPLGYTVQYANTNVARTFEPTSTPDLIDAAAPGDG